MSRIRNCLYVSVISYIKLLLITYLEFELSKNVHLKNLYYFKEDITITVGFHSVVKHILPIGIA